ncbi:Hypothetical protein R9X50_00642800 [Acrodontium crateriforme]|uniref:Acyltransferase 3 domain-containing protein n=1 Tax=Acrodontium crateriforme TaxID=150365 RepID=A0AAQ3MAZ1_9PEZI|nr:Hypothetical protein R9X50_00642800 [Acrodontium crateriforme]
MSKTTTTKSLVGRVRNFYNPNAWDTEPARETQSYLHGIRGLLAISSILWIFFHTFVPTLTAVSAGSPPDGPKYEKVIRDVFSPIFWNYSLISSFFFILSARSICVRFINDPKPASFAGSIIRRLVRLPIAVGLASGIASAVMKGMGTEYIQTFRNALPNSSIDVPQIPYDAVAALNSMFELFWVVRSYYFQAANHFWPSGTIWNLSLMYQQSWTVYFLMLILPYSRASWHIQFLGLFAAGSFWMNTWGWYDAIALLLTDYVINPKLSPQLHAGIKINEHVTIPMVMPGALMTAAGLAMKYVWTLFPQFINEELVLHPYIDLSETTDKNSFAAADPYPRLDNFLFIFGFLLLVETTAVLRSALSANWLVALGKRSLSLFVAQSLVFWAGGIKLFLHLTSSGADTATANAAVFFVCTAGTLIGGEIYYRTVDLPSQWVANWAYRWLTQ